MVHEFDSIPAIKEAVSLGKGISIVPDRLLRDDVAQGRLVAVPLEQPIYRPVGIIHLRRKQFNRATRAFLTLLVEDKHNGSDLENSGNVYSELTAQS